MKKPISRKRIIAFSIGFALLIVIVCVIFFWWKNASNRNPSSDGPHEDYYEGIDDTFSIPITDELSLLNGDVSGYVYFGRDTCEFCRIFNQYLNEINQEYGISIQKYDTDAWRESDYFDQILDAYEIDNIPALVYIEKDGTFRQLVAEEDNDLGLYDLLVEFIDVD